MRAEEFVFIFIVTVFTFSVGVLTGDTIATKWFININYNKEFTVTEKTIKKNGFSYKISNGNKSYNLITKDDLEMNSAITIGAK